MIQLRTSKGTSVAGKEWWGGITELREVQHGGHGAGLTGHC